MSRLAKKQELILRTLEEAQGPMSASELWEHLRATGQTVGIATVYRALRRGVESGALVSVELEAGSVRYEPAQLEHHHHFVCSACDRAFDLVGCVPRLEELLPEGYRMTGHEILLFGTCSSCGGGAE